MTPSAPPDDEQGHSGQTAEQATEQAAGQPLLPLAGQTPPMRADAARNRTRLLEAAARLVAERGPEHLTMEAVAAAASVGKGTVFRRFGDRGGLLMALLDHSERLYQESFLTGPPPLGPGAPPVRRLEEFGIATLRHLAAHRALLLAAEPEACRRFEPPPRRLVLTHLTALLREADVGGDAELLAHTLASHLDVALLHHLTRRRGMPLDRLEAGWLDLVARVTRT
ncbi:hypothetical protein SUDANB106_04770 [Streptomyces sp. enrichment culture]